MIASPPTKQNRVKNYQDCICGSILHLNNIIFNFARAMILTSEQTNFMICQVLFYTGDDNFAIFRRLICYKFSNLSLTSGMSVLSRKDRLFHIYRGVWQKKLLVRRKIKRFTLDEGDFNMKIKNFYGIIIFVFRSTWQKVLIFRSVRII